MGKFNLNKAADFAKATMQNAVGALSGVAGVLSAFAAGPREWDIQESSYGGIKFHIFSSNSDWNAGVEQVQDKGGRRKAKYNFPYKDGQFTDDFGRKAEIFTFNVIIHGDNYMIGYKRLLKKFNQPFPDVLIHPIRGPINCVVEDWDVTHHSDKRKAVAMVITFTEHNYDFSVGKIPSPSTKSFLNKALGAIQNIQGVLLKVQGTVVFAQSVVSKVTTALTDIKAAYTNTVASMNKLFNKSGSEDIPGLVTVNEGGTLGSTSDTFTTAVSPNDPTSSINVSALSTETATALSVLEIEKEVNKRREEIDAIIDDLSTTPTISALGEVEYYGSLEFKQEIIDLKSAAILLQAILESGKKSSKVSIINYTVPRLMTIREIAFENGIPMSRINEIETLNPEMDSVNYIVKDTVLKVPI